MSDESLEAIETIVHLAHWTHLASMAEMKRHFTPGDRLIADAISHRKSHMALIIIYEREKVHCNIVNNGSIVKL